MGGLEIVLAVLGVLVLTSIATVVVFALVLRSIFRRVRRSRAVGDTALKVRANVGRGSARAVAKLRLRLAESLRSGRAAVDLTAGTPGAGRGELPRLFARIQREGEALDLQLRLMESETDASALAEELPNAQRRVDEVVQLVRRVRSGVAAAISGSTDDALADVGAELEREVTALQAGIRMLQELNRRDGRVADRPAFTVRHEGNRP